MTPYLRPVIGCAMVIVGVFSASACGDNSAARSPVTPVAGPAPGEATALTTPFVFHSGRDSRDELLVADQEGGDLRVLVRAGSDPDWSNDGRVAFRSRRGGSNGIVVMFPDGSGERYIGPGEDPSWSPDGQQIAVQHGSSIHVLDANGGAPARLVASPPPGFDLAMQPAWSPDGTTIAFAACTEVLTQWDFGASCSALYTVPADGSEAPTALATGSGAHAPAWSADGRSLAYSAGSSVFVMDFPGGGSRQIGRGEYPAWTPDGRLVYQAPDASGRWRLMINDNGIERLLVPTVASTVPYSDEKISVRR